MNLFYSPEYAKTGDVIPYYNDETKRFEGYYLKNWNPDAPKDMVVYGWHHIVSEDNRNFIETPTNIHGGTGSILKVNGLYHMFYCTFDQEPQAQWARHATSTDLVHWTDIPEEKFTADGEIYRMSDWRDPFVFWNEEEQEWWMLLAARENGATERNGCVALCVSDDLAHWEYRRPLYAPRTHQGAYECPDFFKMGDWYYLVYSSYTDGFSTYYRMSRSPKGPWLKPRVDTFDGRAFYAAKTGTDGKDRFIYGWNPTRGENGWGFDPENDFGKDYQTWNWGGSIVVHKILQHEDGSLGVCPVDSVDNAFVRSEEIHAEGLTGTWTKDHNTLSCCSEYGYSAALAQKIPEQCCIRATLKYTGEPSRFGLALQVDEKFMLAFDDIFVVGGAEGEHGEGGFQAAFRKKKMCHIPVGIESGLLSKPPHQFCFINKDDPSLITHLGKQMTHESKIVTAMAGFSKICIVFHRLIENASVNFFQRNIGNKLTLQISLKEK